MNKKVSIQDKLGQQKLKTPELNDVDLCKEVYRKLLYKVRQKAKWIKKVEITPEMIEKFGSEIDRNYIKSDIEYYNIIKLLALEEENYETIAESNRKREERLYERIKSIENKKGYYYHNRVPRKCLETKIVKDIKKLETEILKKKHLWKKTYMYDVIKDLVESVSKTRKMILDALTIDNNYPDMKYQYYMGAEAELNNIEYLITILYVDLNVITVEEVSLFAILSDEVLRSLSNLMKTLTNKK